MDDLVILYIRKIRMVESMTTICSSNRYFRGGDIGFFMLYIMNIKVVYQRISFFSIKKPVRTNSLQAFAIFHFNEWMNLAIHKTTIFYNNASISSSISRGSVVDSKRLTTSPLRSIKNLVKFHLIESPGKYSGCFSFNNCTINLDTE